MFLILLYFFHEQFLQNSPLIQALTCDIEGKLGGHNNYCDMGAVRVKPAGYINTLRLVVLCITRREPNGRRKLILHPLPNRHLPHPPTPQNKNKINKKTKPYNTCMYFICVLSWFVLLISALTEAYGVDCA